MSDGSSLASSTQEISRPSKSLLSAALCGLLTLGGVAACGEGGGLPPSSTSSEAGASGQAMGAGGDTAGRDTDGGAGAVGSDEYDNVVSDGIDISAEEFQRICDDRGGWMYVTAVCAGAGMCKGLSLLGTKLTDHSCRGLNGCGGAGCVDLPEDMGLSGQQIYAEGPCGGCHGDWSDAEHPKLDVYTVVHGPDVDSEVALKRFRESSKRRLMSVVVFGTRGVHADGTPFSNMPAYYQDYSRAEIERAVEYVQRLPVRTQPYEVFGTTPGFGVPEMTNPAPGSPPAAGGTGGAAP